MNKQPKRDETLARYEARMPIGSAVIYTTHFRQKYPSLRDTVSPVFTVMAIQSRKGMTPAYILTLDGTTVASAIMADCIEPCPVL
jgi:hypothetical protein